MILVREQKKVALVLVKGVCCLTILRGVRFGLRVNKIDEVFLYIDSGSFCQRSTAA